MTIFKGSRYTKLEVTTIRDLTGRLRQFLHDRRIVDIDDLLGDFTLHVVEGGDSIPTLAYVFGGKPSLWWVIADINNRDGMFDIDVGEILLIPSPSFFARF